MKKLIFTSILLSFLSIGITAQTATPGINKTQIRQQARIHQGVKNGELTRAETRNLERQQRKIQADKKMAKADGVVTNAERKQIRHEQNAANKNIYRKKHNNRSRL